MTDPMTNYRLGTIQHAEYEARIHSTSSGPTELKGKQTQLNFEEAVQRVKEKIFAAKSENLVACQGDI